MILRASQSIGVFFDGGRILAGRDGRTSGEMISMIVKSALLSAGCSVCDVGLAPTPCIQYTVRFGHYDGAVVVTASHNPPRYNGLKVVGRDGIEISRDEEEQIERVFFEGRWTPKVQSQLGSMKSVGDILTPYQSAIEGRVDTEVIRRSGLKLVVDPGNGVGALITPRLLSAVGCDVQTINAAIDGTFPGRPPEPTPENLQGLSKTVKLTGADLGIAHDGDADRAIFVAENGEVEWGDRTFALVEKHFLMSNPGETIVTPVSSSQLVRDIAEEQGGRVEWTRVGSINVSRRMEEIGSKLGGEENGGIFYGPHIPVRDGAMAAAMIVELLAKTGRKLSELLGELPHYHIIKTKIGCPENRKDHVLAEVTKVISGRTVETIDGVKIWRDRRSWILIRPSGTEPIFRIFVEAPSRDEANNLLGEYVTVLRDLIDEGVYDGKPAR